MNKIYLLLGSNMGNSRQRLVTACGCVEKEIGTIIRKSHLYETAAWGNTNQADFVNQVVLVHSVLSAEKCLEHILSIEKIMGRIRTVKNAPRIIDIDILYFNKDIINTSNLQVPHPAIAERRFVLTPLNEIASQFIHPVHLQNNNQLLEKCTDPLSVKKIAS